MSPSFYKWVNQLHHSGKTADEMVALLVNNGWIHSQAVQNVNDYFTKGKDAIEDPNVAPPSLSSFKIPEPLLDGNHVVDVGDKIVRAILTVKLPRVVVFENFLSDEECDELVLLAKGRVQRSTTVDRETGGSQVHEARTSDGMFFTRGENPLVSTIETRIGKLLNWPVEFGEGLQVLNYGVGKQYKPHHDYFDPASPGSKNTLTSFGQRVGTLLMYLNSPPKGGGTVFPETGIEVQARKGNALFFSYDKAHPSTKSLHGGSPVLEGEKWVATKWLRSQRFH